jgi:hypothetical protein
LSYQAVEWVQKHAGTRSAVEQAITMVIASHAHKDGTGARLSLETIAREARVNRRTAQRTLKHLTNGAQVLTSARSGRSVYHFTILGMQVGLFDDLMGGRESRKGRHSAAPGAAESTGRGGTAPPKPVLNRSVEPVGLTRAFARRGPPRDRRLGIGQILDLADAIQNREEAGGAAR